MTRLGKATDDDHFLYSCKLCDKEVIGVCKQLQVPGTVGHTYHILITRSQSLMETCQEMPRNSTRRLSDMF